MATRQFPAVAGATLQRVHWRIQHWRDVPSCFGDTYYIVSLEGWGPGASLDWSWFFEVFEGRSKIIRDVELAKGDDGNDR